MVPITLILKGSARQKCNFWSEFSKNCLKVWCLNSGAEVWVKLESLYWFHRAQKINLVEPKKNVKKKHFKLVFKSEPLLPEKFLDAFMDFLREIHTKNEVSQIIKDEL